MYIIEYKHTHTHTYDNRHIDTAVIKSICTGGGLMHSLRDIA